MKLKWCARPAAALMASFNASPALRLRVRSLQAHYKTARDWQVEWEETLVGEAAVSEANRRWPQDGLEDADLRLARRNHRDFVRAEATTGMVERGDDIWMSNKDASRQNGQDLFWEWVSGLQVRRLCESPLRLARMLTSIHQSLKSLNVSAFSYTVSPSLQTTLRSVFEALEAFVARESVQSDFALAILRDVRVLQIEITEEEDPEYQTMASSAMLSHVTHLYAFWEGEPTYTLFTHVDPSNLVALRISNASKPESAALLDLLPRMTSLRSLHISAPFIDMPPFDTQLDGASLAAAITHTSLVHLSINDWPNPQLLSSIPSTLRSLVVSTDPDDTFNARMDECLLWKELYLPAIESLAIFLRGWGAGYVQGMVKIAEASERADQFRLTVDEDDSPPYAGQWVL